MISPSDLLEEIGDSLEPFIHAGSGVGDHGRYLTFEPSLPKALTGDDAAARLVVRRTGRNSRPRT
jgi:hypothetical protein